MNANLQVPVGVSPDQSDKRRGMLLMGGIVFGFLGLSVLVHAVAITYVFTAQTDVVRPDYYEAGQNYEQEIALKRAAAGLAFDVRMAAGPTERISVVLPNAPGRFAGVTGRLKLYRPGDARLDRVVALPAPKIEGGEARWTTEGVPLAKGRWRVRLELDATPPLAVELDRNL